MPFGKRGSTYHSLRQFVTCYPVLRMGASEHSPWWAPLDDLDDSSYQGSALDFSIFQPQEVALVGEPAEADTQLLIDTTYAAYLPNKVVAGCAPDEEDAGLILLLADRPARAMAGRPPTSVKLRLPESDDRPGWRGCSRSSFVLVVCRRFLVRWLIVRELLMGTTTRSAFLRRCPRFLAAGG